MTHMLKTLALVLSAVFLSGCGAQHQTTISPFELNGTYSCVAALDKLDLGSWEEIGIVPNGSWNNVQVISDRTSCPFMLTGTSFQIITSPNPRSASSTTPVPQLDYWAEYQENGLTGVERCDNHGCLAIALAGDYDIAISTASLVAQKLTPFLPGQHN